MSLATDLREYPAGSGQYWALHEAFSDNGCETQCDDCHTYESCTPGDFRLGDLLLCNKCYCKRTNIEPPF